MTTATPLDIRVEVATLPETEIAYVRHVGPFQGRSEVFAELFGRLMRWAGPRGLLQGDGVQMLSVYHDDPDITDETRQRVSVGLAVPADTSASGEIGRMTLPGGRYAIAHAVIDPARYGDAWDWVYGEWLPESGYQPDDRPALELYRNDPEQHPEKKHVVDICVPVKPL